MSNSLPTHETEDEEVQLNLIPGTCDAPNNSTTCHEVVIVRSTDYCCDNNHRKLAIFSIICGLSCIGVKALIYSVKAETTSDPERAAAYSQRAKKISIISILTWVSILALTPMLMALVSYILTLQD